MKYMMFVATDPQPDASAAPPPDIEEWFRDVNGRGKWVLGDRLRPVGEATLVRVRDGELLTTDAPFAESKEWIAGFDVLDCASLEEAIEIASRHPVARAGRIELRPFWAADGGNQHTPLRGAIATQENLPLPEVVDRHVWQQMLDALLAREKAHTREGDAIAALRRRLPMVEVDPATLLVGQHGPVPLIEAFEGRRQLLAYFHMWHDGHPTEEQCEGCTFFTGQVRELSYLHSRDVTYATFCQGTYEESAAYRDFMGWDMPWYSAKDSADALLAGRSFGMQVCYLRDGKRVFETYWSTGRAAEVFSPTYGLLDMTVYGRQETWEDSPEGWPQPFRANGAQFRTEGRPTAQWSRIAGVRPAR